MTTTISHQLKVLGEKPFNAEPDIANLIQHSLTPSELVYCRNHCGWYLPIPVLCSSFLHTADVQEFDDRFIVTVDGLVQRKIELSVGDLKARFSPKTVVAALQVSSKVAE